MTLPEHTVSIGEIMAACQLDQKVYVRIITRDHDNVGIHQRIVPVTGPIRTLDDGSIILNVENADLDRAWKQPV